MAQKKTSHRTAEEKAATAAKRDARRARTERAREQAEERRKAAKRKEQLTRIGLVAGVLVLIVGSEGDGLSRLVREACDTIASIPITASVESLNAGVATGIALYEIFRHRS